jgi:hypothetical protein
VPITYDLEVLVEGQQGIARDHGECGASRVVGDHDPKAV